MKISNENSRSLFIILCLLFHREQLNGGSVKESERAMKN
jgi:hypothetical protein